MGICFKGKPKTSAMSHDQQLLLDKEILSDCVTALEVCIVRLESHSDIKKQLFDLQEKIKYSSPKAEAISADQKMRRVVDDIRVAAFAAVKDEKFAKLTELIAEVRLILAAR